MSKEIYGFQIHKFLIDVKATSEQNALIQLIKHRWDLIDKYGEIKLLGKQEPSTTKTLSKKI